MAAGLRAALRTYLGRNSPPLDPRMSESPPAIVFLSTSCYKAVDHLSRQLS
jgi:hypothetical protein